MADIRWKSLVDGCRDPKCTQSETEKRIAEAHVLLEHIFSMSVAEALRTLLLHNNTAEWIVENTLFLPKYTLLRQPTVAALLAFKDRLCITDHEWPYVVEVMQLGPGRTLHYLRQLRNKANNQLEPTMV